MNDPRPDAELRERFQQLRSEERAAAPDFAELFGRVRAGASQAGDHPVPAAPGTAPAGRRWRMTGPRWLWAGGSLAAAAAVAALMLFNPGSRADREFERTVRAFTAATQWRSPTDALLQLPGSEITRSVPRVGATNWPGDASGTSRRLRS